MARTYTLLLTRHAKSSWSHVDLPDFERPLNDRGRRAAKRMGTHLRTKNLAPDLVVSSPSVRTRETLALFESGMAAELKVEFDDRLYFGTFEDLKIVVESALKRNCSNVLILGHNPGLEWLLRSICPDSIAELNYKKLLPTCSVAQIQFSGQLGSSVFGSGDLIAIHRAKLI